MTDDESEPVKIRTMGILLSSMAMAVTLTACNDNAPDAAKGNGGSKSQGKGVAEGEKDPASGGGSSTGGSSGGTSGGDVPKCKASQLSFSFEPVSRPLNHVVLEAKNDGTSACRIPKAHPRIVFALETGEPAAYDPKTDDGPGRITLSPGQSAFSGVMTLTADAKDSDIMEATEASVSLDDEDSSKDIEMDNLSITSPEVGPWSSTLEDALNG
ncbi:DUF4232 domain-containing protein [Streptomyces sp. NPDC047108]|uniref:DUF4232 domain-containing protein n=1 Tax=Streptomyces sp. NPDC047108 TaxID=3155025 RepID=UPI00340E1BF7